MGLQGLLNSVNGSSALVDQQRSRSTCTSFQSNWGQHFFGVFYSILLFPLTNKIIQYRYDIGRGGKNISMQVWCREGWRKRMQNYPANKHIALDKTLFYHILLAFCYFFMKTCRYSLEVCLWGASNEYPCHAASEVLLMSTHNMLPLQDTCNENPSYVASLRHFYWVPMAYCIYEALLMNTHHMLPLWDTSTVYHNMLPLWGTSNEYPHVGSLRHF